MSFKDYLIEYLKPNVLGDEDIYQLTVKGDRNDLDISGDLDLLLKDVNKINQEPNDIQKIFNINLNFQDNNNPKWDKQLIINKLEGMIKKLVKDEYVVVQPEIKLIKEKPYVIQFTVVINKGEPEGKAIGRGRVSFIPTYL